VYKKILVKIFTAVSTAVINTLEPKTSQQVKERCADFVVAEYHALQPVHKIGISIIATYLEASSILVRRKRFTKCAFKEQQEIITHWLSSNIYPKKAFMQFFANFTVLALYDSHQVLKNHGIDIESYKKTLRFYYE